MPGFIPELNAHQRKRVVQLLTYWKDNREQASIFAVKEDDEAKVIEFAHKYWLQIQEKGTLDINPIKAKKRNEKDRELVFEYSIKNSDGAI